MKSEVEVARVAPPSGWFTIVFFVILVNVNDVVAGDMRVCGVCEEGGAAVLAICGTDGLMTTACVVCTRVHCDGVAD